MGYWQQADLPFYYSLASVFPIADRYFCSLLGQTYPNRRYLMAATSIGQVNDTTPALTDYPANGTIFDRLDAHGISWKDYFTNLATPELFPPLFLKNQGTKIVPIGGFFTDAAAGTLPGFCPWARPRYVSHRVFDHASICKLVETKWNLPAMTYRDANAANLLDLLDLRRPAFRTPPRLAAPLLDTDPAALACDTSGPGVIPPPGSITTSHAPHAPRALPV